MYLCLCLIVIKRVLEASIKHLNTKKIHDQSYPLRTNGGKDRP